MDLRSETRIDYYDERDIEEDLPSRMELSRGATSVIQTPSISFWCGSTWVIHIPVLSLGFGVLKDDVRLPSKMSSVFRTPSCKSKQD